MMDNICDKKDCCGCALCAAMCPVSCISMVAGDHGHLYPVIDNGRCVDCGLCRRNCIANRQPEFGAPIVTYASWAKDEPQYVGSTSGGIATLLARNVIVTGGVVYGCAMLDDIDVRHIRVDSLADVDRLRGSKYVQSTMLDIMRPLRDDVKAGRQVLFIGTPCQVAAVRNMFGRPRPNLLLVDIICHGTPSLGSLRRHLHRVAPAPRYGRVTFRDGNEYVLAVESDGRVIYRKGRRDPVCGDLYLSAFFDGFTFRDSCYRCKYTRGERVSDITVGDFWGLGRHIPADEIPPHPHGCSAVMVNTQAGVELFGRIKDDCNHYERTAAECVAGNEQLRHPKVAGFRIRLYRMLSHSGRWPGVYRAVNLDKIVKYLIKRLIGRR